MRIITISYVVWATILSTFAGGQSLRTISVTGQGMVTSAPDMATITAGVTTTAETASVALEENNAVVGEVFSVLTGDPYAIPEEDLQTSSFQVYPQYNYTTGVPELVGYSVSNSVSVAVRNLDVLGQLLDALVTAGANQIDGISFGFNDTTALTRQARRMAMTDAQGRATLYANAAQVTLGSILFIQEPGAVEYPRDEKFEMPAADMGGAVPIATGEQGISATINVVYEIAN